MQIKLRRLVPAPLLSSYHFLLAHFGSILYGHPSRKLLVIAVTGTKGKSSTTEMLNAILEESGRKTALLNSIRIKVGADSEANTMRMSMPGRFFIQKFLARAVRAKCDAAILEMTSEGARQYRHRAIELDALVFTNLAPEHIESHGSYEAYADAKFEIGKQLARSGKRPRIVAANEDDTESSRYLALPVEKTLAVSLSRQQPWFANERGGYFTFDGAKIAVRLPGEFSLKNALEAATVARAIGIDAETIVRAIGKLDRIPGRAERVDAGQDFAVVVDYAHTPDSLEALYDAYGHVRKICVMGATGGGRDTWKRPVMGALADTRCDVVILTNEDPYDEDPRAIVEALASGMKRTPEIVMDRRDAIRRGISLARAGDAVLITGKGTDPCICGPRGSKVPWSDAGIAREELGKLKRTREV
jgi:UDP-N-acetylmuramoyl-L-alanyl-D-glutamate--2,6-diaminopimelate ligase